METPEYPAELQNPTFLVRTLTHEPRTLYPARHITAPASWGGVGRD